MNKKSSNSGSKKPAKAAKPAPEKTRPAVNEAELLNKEELEQIRRALLARSEMLAGNVNRMEDEALRNAGQSASGDLSSMPFHMADLGTDNFEQEMTLGLIENEEEELREIGDALQRIEAGGFGSCEDCGKTIPKERIKAIPYTRLCVECKRKEEEEGD